MEDTVALTPSTVGPATALRKSTDPKSKNVTPSSGPSMHTHKQTHDIAQNLGHQISCTHKHHQNQYSRISKHRNSNPSLEVGIFRDFLAQLGPPPWPPRVMGICCPRLLSAVASLAWADRSCFRPQLNPCDVRNGWIATVVFFFKLNPKGSGQMKHQRRVALLFGHGIFVLSTGEKNSTSNTSGKPLFISITSRVSWEFTPSKLRSWAQWVPHTEPGSLLLIALAKCMIP